MPLTLEWLHEQCVRTPSGCLEWQGHRDVWGYGKVRRDGRTQRTHRVAWELANDREVPDGLQVLHRCDNPPCCDDAHLFLGTNADNVADKVKKGRQARKLNEDDIREIRALYGEGSRTLTDIGDAYGVSRSLIHLIVRRKIWAQVD